MKKNILLSSLLFAVLFLGANSAQSAPPPPHHGAPHSGHYQMHRPLAHGHMHRPPRMHHHHHVRHYSGFISPCYYSYHYPIGLGARVYYPLYHSHLGASFHINL